MVHQKSKLFNETLVEVFPVHSQPKVILRPFKQDKRKKVEQCDCHLFFGYLIPK